MEGLPAGDDGRARHGTRADGPAPVVTDLIPKRFIEVLGRAHAVVFAL